MSSNSRSTAKGGKGPKGDKAHRADKADAKAGDKQHSGASGGGDTKSNEHKINQLLEMTQRSENQVCLALHECDYDMERAIHMLLDLPDEDKWETTVKKRKNRQQSASKADPKADCAVTTTTTDDWGDAAATTGDKDKPRNKTSGQRFHGRHNDSRGWRGREKQENERNLEDGPGGRERRGRPGGSTRGAGGARGRGGGRAGGRYPARSRGSGGGGGGGGTFNNRPMETWDNSWDAAAATAPHTTNHTEENWGDEFPGADEWCGNLTETKVFTPSQQQQLSDAAAEPDSKSATTMDNTSPLGASVQQSMDMLAQMSAAQNAPVAMSGTLNAAQTQYFSQLTQQSNNNELKYAVQSSPQQQQQQAPYGNNNAPAPVPSVAANNTYGGYNNSAYAASPNDLHAQAPARAKVQRAKLPPPSKIPSKAVEMPGDLNSSMGLLDLQFGAMDIMSDSSSFDGIADGGKYAPSAMLDAGGDLSGGAQPGGGVLNAVDAYSPSKPSAQSSISSALTASLSNSDSIPQQQQQSSAELYNPAGGGAGSQRSSAVSNSNAPPEHGKVDAPQAANYSYAAYQSKAAGGGGYPQQAYSSSNYSSTQTTNSYVPQQPQQQQQQQGNSYVNSDSSYANSGGGGGNNSYQNTYAANSNSGGGGGGYQSANTGAPPFPTISSQGGNAVAYPSANPSSYQQQQQNASQSVYGGGGGGNTAGLNSSAASYGNASTQYNNYSSNHKMGKESGGGGAYESAATVAASSLSTTSTASTPLTLASTTSASKSNATLSKNSNSVVSNIPPSATPVMGQYIMGQVPYFQPPMYSYEEMQMLQQRMPHMTTPFYEMSYQTPATTTLREGSYSLSDGRFTRTDSNASPVSSTQTSTQPMLAAQTSGPYFFTPYNPMQPSYQFGAVYTSQLPAGTNAHGSSSSAQYAKPATYGSGYTSGYDALGQSADYSKGGYVGNAQGGQQGGKGGAANATSAGGAGNDLSAMYGKSHTALGKVNSYEKQGFHSGTPPPFTGALGQSALAPSGTGYGPQMYIPTLPHQQHHSTPLMHQPLHQMDVRHHGRRMDSGNSTGQRAQGNNQQKAGSKQAYPTSYWNQS